MHAKQTKITIYDIPCFLSNINDFEILVLNQRMSMLKYLQILVLNNCQQNPDLKTNLPFTCSR